MHDDWKGLQSWKKVNPNTAPASSLIIWTPISQSARNSSYENTFRRMQFNQGPSRQPAGLPMDLGMKALRSR